MSSEKLARTARGGRGRGVPARLRTLRHRRHYRQRSGRPGAPARPHRKLLHLGFARPAAGPHLPGTRRSPCIAAFRTAKYFGINVLAEDQRALSERFARKGHDRFDGLDWRPARPACRCWRASWLTWNAPSTDASTAGDHDIFIGEMVGAGPQGRTPGVLRRPLQAACAGSVTCRLDPMLFT